MISGIRFFPHLMPHCLGPVVDGGGGWCGAGNGSESASPVVAKYSQGAQMPAEQIVLTEAGHIELDRIIDRAEMRLEQYALHVQGLANDKRQALIARTEFERGLNALNSLRTHHRNRFKSPLAQNIENRSSRSQAEPTMANLNSHLSNPSARQGSEPSVAATFRNGLLAELPRLRAFARSLARDPDRADDLVQETLVKAWAHHAKFKEGTNLIAWLFTILRNTYYGQLRSQRREVSDADGHHAAQLCSAPAQLHNLELQNVAQAFGGLTAGQREALFLVGVSGLTYNEAARIVGCAVGTIKSRVFRARLILLDRLGPQKHPQAMASLRGKAFSPICVTKLQAASNARAKLDAVKKISGTAAALRR